MTPVRLGMLCGALWGIGALLVWRGLPKHRRVTLQDRVAPYIRDQVAVPSRLLTGHQSSRGWIPVLTPVLAVAARGIDRVLADGATVQRRQQRAGLAADLEGFRLQQVWCALAGAGVGVLIGTIGSLAGRWGPVVTVMMVLVSAALGVVGWDQLLSWRADRRERTMLAEFPIVAEFLALAVGAGEGAVGALERASRLSRGELADELRRCLADARAGSSLPVALSGLSERTGLPGLARFVDGIVVAVERGTPLADVLRAQAHDVREASRREVMEAAGRKEILMMIPVVFLILPVTVVFALFPGLSFLDFQM